MFTAAIYIIIKTWKQSKSPLMEGYIKKMSYTHRGILFIHKMNETFPFVTTQMDISLMLSEVSQTEKQIPCDFTYMYNLKRKKKKLTDAENRSRLPEAGQGVGYRCNR